MNTRQTRWTEEELETLEQMRKDGVLIHEIATRLGRTRQSVMRKSTNYIADRKMPIIQDPVLAEIVKDGYHKGEMYSEIGKRIGHDRQMVRRIVRRLGLSRRKRYHLAAYKVYPEELVENLRKLYIDQDLPLHKVSKQLGIGYQLTNSIVASRGLRKRPVEWDVELEQEFKKLLRENASLLKMCRALNRSDIAVISFSKYLGIYNETPILHKRIPIEERRRISFILNKFVSISLADRRKFKQENQLKLTTVFDLFEKQEGKCAYTGIPLVFRSNHIGSISIDRIDSNKPHVADNIVLCTAMVNTMKQDLTVQEFVETCDLVCRHNIFTSTSGGVAA